MVLSANINNIKSKGIYRSLFFLLTVYIHQSIQVYVYQWLSLALSLCILGFKYLPVFFLIHICSFLFMYIYHSLFKSISLSQPIPINIHIGLFLSIYLSIYLFITVNIDLSLFISIYEGHSVNKGNFSEKRKINFFSEFFSINLNSALFGIDLL